MGSCGGLYRRANARRYTLSEAMGKTTAEPKGSGTRRDDNGGGDLGGNGGGNGKPTEPDDGMSVSRLGVWLGLASIGMVFGALTVMYLVRLSEKPNYVFVVPKALWFSTAFILISSWTAYRGLRAIRADDAPRLSRLLGLTMALGMAFLASQAYAWMNFYDAGMFDPKNPFSSLFLLMTGVHAFHVVFGLFWSAYVYHLARLRVFSQKKHLAVELFSSYWHFMDGTWVVFFVLLMFV